MKRGALAPLYFIMRLRILVLVCAFIFPFLNFLHYVPVADWWTNALVVFCSVLAGIVLFFQFRRDNEVLVIELCLVLFFAGNALAGFFMHINPGSFNSLLGCLVVMLVLSRYFYVQKVASNDEFVCDVAKVVFAGGLLQVILGLLQVFGLAPLMHGYVMYDPANPAGNIMGNIAQRNLYGHYLAWAMFSACYLYSREILRLPFLLLAQLFLGLLIAWSGGRLILGYVTAAIVWGILWRLRADRNERMVKMVFALFIVLFTVFFTQLCLQQINDALSWVGFRIDLQSGVERLFDHGFGARRRIEWTKAWILFNQHPWFGVGWDGYASAANWLEVHGGLPKVPESWLFAHCHNLVFQLLAETGLFGTSIFMFSLALLILPFFWKKNATTENLFIIIILSVTLIHSMFEFPLWYLPFLAMFILTLSLSPQPVFHLQIRAIFWRGMYVIFFILCFFYVVVGVFRFNTLTRESMPTADVHVNQKRIEKLSVIRLDPLWSDDASFALARFLSPSRDHLSLKLDIYDPLLSYRPQPFILQNGALLHALAGDTSKASDLIKQFIVVYPDQVLSLCFYLDRQADTAYIPLRTLADQACQISMKYPGNANDDARRLAIVNAFAAPVTRKALF
ncbi:PglL family O-oligosaccharyltransferase [Aquitalea sp. LB_tupeE]|uniref:PglL family O-oligosaccharyltransferase n=1 Tax=Aquitalea sp. LB_tupeE TaxID=2748078 RepID=UPI0015C13E2A|nr:O-antigen ligase family protein [Aquitalea sp. LB_tupeE]NWK77421.1 O-antigen ligase C-terminal domain-containing protein [Aquitalea sp. LB_tupeE]